MMALITAAFHQTTLWACFRFFSRSNKPSCYAEMPMQAAFLLTEEMVQNHKAMAKGIANT